ncbi:DUF4386 domain-containing protein [Micromonospora sp. NBC_00389]|uniref:DUF4386 domain-containing protein n=1 Tax=Micromonospora sp. NBC_00389 TaxID=2903586 RepID=UPI002E1BAB83
MTSLRKIALVAGALYLLTFVSIPTLALYGPVREPNYIVGPGPDTAVMVGGVLEMIVALACIGTAVVLYPVVKRQNEAVALGFVGVRVLEAATIVAGVVILMSVVTLRQAGAGADALVTGQALVAMRDWTFMLGQGFLPAVNALLLGFLLYRSRLVPRVLPLLGFIGAPLLVASAAATLFGLWEQASAPSALLTIPIALWGAVPWRLVSGQGLQALTHHNWHGRHQHPARQPRPHPLWAEHLTAEHTAGAHKARPLSAPPDGRDARFCRRPGAALNS